MKDQPFDPRDHEAFVREIDDSRYLFDKDMVPRGVIPKRRSMSLSRSLAMEGTFPFPNFAPRLLASLVASSTADCTSGVVTVTAAAHGIPATTFNGYHFHYPGSTSLAAGWYADFQRTGADTVTFSAPLAADFTSESVNAGAAFTSEVTYESIIIPRNTLQIGDIVSVPSFRMSNNTAGTRTVRIRINGTLATYIAASSTTAIIGSSELCFAVDSAVDSVGHTSLNGTLSNVLVSCAIDINSEMTVTHTGQLSAAAMYMACISKSLRIL